VKTLLWLGGAVILGVAAISVYWAFQSPTFVAGLTALAAGAVWKALAPAIAKRMTLEDEAAWQAAERAGRGDEFMRRRRGAPPKG